MSHPDNPKDTIWSAYRDYGRFGAFVKPELKNGDSLTLRYRFWGWPGKPRRGRNFSGSGRRSPSSSGYFGVGSMLVSRLPSQNSSPVRGPHACRRRAADSIAARPSRDPEVTAQDAAPPNPAHEAHSRRRPNEWSRFVDASPIRRPPPPHHVRLARSWELRKIPKNASVLGSSPCGILLQKNVVYSVTDAGFT